MNINEILNGLNVWSKCGCVGVLDGEDRDGCGFDGLSDEDVVVYYDWVDDELSDDERDEFGDWLYDGFFEKLRDEMEKLGYVKVFDYDGSGGGLYYGCEVYRKS